MRSPIARAALPLAMAVVFAACSGRSDGSESGESAARDGRGREPAERLRGEATGTLDWEACGELECATLTVPLDHDRPDGTTIELAVARRPANDGPIGALVTNPGGPGASGIELLGVVDRFFSAEVLDRFDVVSWDPRGVGSSTPVNCADDLDFFYATDKSPDDPAETAENLDAAGRLARACAEGSGDLLPYVSTDATARDLDLLRAALGEDRLTYLGFSYGSLVGALYAELFPERVRAMVLDGAVDPSLDFEQLARDQAVGFERALDAFLDDCAARGCGFGGRDPHRAYDLLMDQIDAERLFAEIGGEARELGPGEADLGVAVALYEGDAAWPLLARALNGAAQGDGSLLLSLADTYTGREPGGGYSNQTEAFYAIGCLDGPAPAPDELAPLAQRIAAEAPRFGPATVWLSAPCSVWPVAPGADAPIGTDLRAAGAPPLVVIGTTRDPATPLRWAEGLAEQLEPARLVVLDGAGHTAYGRGHGCIDDIVERYLVDLEPPADGTRCE